MKVSFIHSKHLRAQFEFVIKDSTFPESIIYFSGLLTGHIDQFSCFITIFGLRLFSGLSLFLCQLFCFHFCEEFSFQRQSKVDGPDAVLPDGVALGAGHDLLNEHNQLVLDDS